MKISDSKSRYRAFTLTELLVVIAIIAVLVAISVSVVFSFRKAADKAIVISNMRQLQTANVSYASDHSSTFVSPTVWWRNPDFVSQLKSAEATYGSGGVPNVDLPISLMDPAIAKKRAPGYEELAGSYAYNTQGMTEVSGVKQGYKLSLVADPGRTMAFITADISAAGVVDQGDAGNIAYRHDKKAIAVYYDGHAAPIAQTVVSGVPGGATGGFWDANPDD